MLIPPPPGALGILLPYMYPPVKSVGGGSPSLCSSCCRNCVAFSMGGCGSMTPPPRYSRETCCLMLCLSHLRQVQLPSGAPGTNDQVLGEEEALPLPLLPQGQGAQPSTRHLPLLRHRHLDEGPCERRGTAVTALAPGDTGSSAAAHKDSRPGWQPGVGTLCSPNPCPGASRGGSAGMELRRTGLKNSRVSPVGSSSIKLASSQRKAIVSLT